jgi:membrane protein DedA with SNARE-associated domain
MLEYIASQLQAFFIDYGVFGVFFANMIEEIIAPIPSSIIILGSSFFILEGQTININSILTLIFNIAIPTSLGMTTGSLVIYGFCYHIGEPFITKWGKYLGIKWEDIEQTGKKFEEHSNDELILYLSRALPILPSVAIGAFCGIIRYDLKKYIIITFLAGLTKATYIGFIGWQFGNYYREIAGHLSFLEDIFIIIAVIGIIGYIIYKRKRSK